MAGLVTGDTGSTQRGRVDWANAEDWMRALSAVAGVVVIVMLASCAPQGDPAPLPPRSSPTESLEPPDPNTVGPVTPTGTATEIATGLTSPWSMVRLETGSTLISERDTALVKELTAGGQVREVGAVPGVSPGGEGGLLGLAVHESWLYAYFTSESDNRIVRMELRGSAGSYALGPEQDILVGLAKAGNHNGGRIKFGPDGMLYATVGDAARPAFSQDPASLNGKILRMTPDGGVPEDNPTPGSLVYSMGHRNPQGITWDGEGRLWAAEFGQGTWDEFNLIEPGANYGWPIVEGIGSDPAYVNPVAQWATSEASPSGLVWTRDTFFLASLRGQRVWAIYTDQAEVSSVPWFTGEFGRIRDVIAGPDGSLWILTNNTDGRGNPSPGDDRILQFSLSLPVEG